MGPRVRMDAAGEVGVRGQAGRAGPAGPAPAGERGEAAGADKSASSSASGGSGLQTVDRVRTQFVETWMWTDSVAGYWLPWEPGIAVVIYVET